jgi:hypothetical protein
MNSSVFQYVRVEREADRPAPDPQAIDVAVLDMNHGWPNVGHDAIVLGIQAIACDVREDLAAAGLRVRVVSYDVRRRAVVPPPPRPEDEEGGLFIGTGGPGHLDPRCNDGVSEGSQTIAEDPAWEAPLFACFDAIRAHRRAALIGVCHTFGVMCRWLDIAKPALRGPEKGGKSAGVLDNLLTPAADAHPWFHRLIEESPGGARIRILDNRLYDLLPIGNGRKDVTVLSTETIGVGGPAGEGLTMIEAARDEGGAMPRILAVNHHPEVVDRERILTVLWQKRMRDEVSHEWYEERARALTQTLLDEDSDRRLDLTSRYTLFEPVRFHLYRRIRERAARAGQRLGLHEDRVLHL